jgi:hypothetical protein
MRAKTEFPEPARERTVAFASVILAVSLFAVLWPHRDSAPAQHSAGGVKAQDSQDTSLPRDNRPGWGPVSF